MNINGLLVHANPQRVNDVAARLAALDGVEVHEMTDDGRFVVTVEDVGGKDPGDAVLEIHQMDGVLSAALVFHHREENEDERAKTRGARD